FPLRITEDDWAPRLVVAVPLGNRDAFVRAAAELEAVAWMEPWRSVKLHNNNALGPIQSGTTGENSRTIFAQGITGTGQIAAVADSGADIDMCFFRNLNGNEAVTPASETIAPETGALFPANKVIGYWVQENADAYDDNESCDDAPTGFHGTHVAGSVVGDNLANPSSPSDPGIDRGDGMAPNGQLLFQDIGAANGCLIINDRVRLLFEQAFRGGARVHNNSWGADTAGEYTILDAEVDRFLFENSDMAIFVSAGNHGSAPETVGSPAVSKSVFAVGAVGSGESTTIAGFSSRGPATDGRIKPDIVAPGSSITSAFGDAESGNGNCATGAKSGTSMASPITAGAAMLLRQYFADGFYPSGSRNESDRFEPSGVLVKAALLNGTNPLPEDGEFGGNDYGWGKVLLDSNLYFQGEDRDLRVFDLPNLQGLRSGLSHDYEITVDEGEELRVTLTWFDPEATLGAATQLVNDLDLEVTNGTETYLGNQFGETGVSITGGEPDSLNTTEQVRLPSPDPGTYTITVRGTSIPGTGRLFTDRQGYALVVSSARCESDVVSAPTGLNAGTNPVFGIDLSWTPASDSSSTQIYRAIAGTE
ncbi:MAG: S8 family serine peptidase, partial [Thermoanaerobaculia bacterium]|nr:S8 family serine peptidase [Thermoanaerobaculia bacterium]